MLGNGGERLLRFLVIQNDVLLSVGQNLLDGVVAEASQHQSKPAGLDKSFLADTPSQGEDALAGLVSLLGIMPHLDHLGEILLYRLPNRFGLV